MPNEINCRDSIAIIGLGKVGTAVGYLLKSAGYPIVAASGRSLENLRDNMKYTGGRVFASPAEAASLAECILITTSDDAIASVCKEIVVGGAVRVGKKVIHLSGSGGLDLLQDARGAGALVGSIHPLQSFASIEGAIKSIPGSAFGITADEAIKDWSVRMVLDLGGIPFFISEDNKPLYHIAACIASNYLTTLMHIVEEIYLSIGMERSGALDAFWPLVQGTMNNLQTKGTVQALTGPIARGDAGTIEKHLTAIRKKMPHILPFYCIVGMKTVEVGLKKKTLKPQDAEIIRNMLKGGLNNG